VAVPQQLAELSKPKTDALDRLSAQGVAIWLDDLSRELLAGGGLQRLVDDFYVVGVTTNPTIFASALAHGDRYQDQLSALRHLGADLNQAVFEITTDDVRQACDVLAPVYDTTGHSDGSVSIEVDPRLARDTAATIEVARQLWQAVDRPNLYIKIPATLEGLPAITQVISEGISVNVTLIFSRARYLQVLDAYANGLESALDHGLLADIPNIRSVASFFISRIDADIDARLTADGRPQAVALRGTAAIANARLAYQAFQDFTRTPRWKGLALAGATPQRPLWASTGVKDPAYPDTLYVTSLVTADTVNTMPAATLAAVADHGVISGDTITSRYHAAATALHALADVGIDLDAVTERLERDGLTKFENSWQELMSSVNHALHP